MKTNTKNVIYLIGCFAFVLAVCAAVGIYTGLHSFYFAWVLNFMLMTGVLFSTQTFKPQLTSVYYHPKKWEAEGKIYRRLGVNVFRKILVWVGWEKIHKVSNPVKPSLEALVHLEQGTRQSEFGHLIIFFIVLAISAGVALYAGFGQSLWLIATNIVLNAYPIMVQRYNRPRLQSVIRRIKGI